MEKTFLGNLVTKREDPSVCGQSVISPPPPQLHSESLEFGQNLTDFQTQGRGHAP